MVILNLNLLSVIIVKPMLHKQSCRQGWLWPNS